MVVRALEMDKNPFRLKEIGEGMLGPEYPYLSDMDVLLYLVNNTRSDIAFTVNCFTRHSAAPTKRH
jgi:hypothetical protein